MAKAKKLPSGQWRTLVYDYTDSSGKRFYESFTADSKKESEYLAAEFALNKKSKKVNKLLDITIDEAMKQYCDVKSNVLSPSTLRGYRQMMNSATFTNIKDTKLKDINKQDIQKWVNGYSVSRSAKTVSNAYGFLTAVLYYFDENMHLNITLPKKQKYDAYVPTDAEVQKLIEYYKENNTNMLISSCLAAFGTMRRSEICGLEAKHIDGRTIKVRQSMVQDSNGDFILKSIPKTYSSYRDIPMPQFVIDLLPSAGKIVTVTPAIITLTHIRTLNKLKINKFRFHDLRHYSASIMHALGIPDQYIMQRGGWSSDKVLKEIYRGTMDDYEKKFEDVMMQHYNEMQHEMQHKKINP